MSHPDTTLTSLLAIVERIALDGDLSAVQPLLDIAEKQAESPLAAALAEAFSRMVVQLEAREFRLEGIIEQLEAAKTELEQANYDPLTRLPNRVICRDRLRQALAQQERSGQLLAVFYLDLDRFKWVNDHLGHDAGDEILCQVAARLQACLRESDTLARIGGDEFVCVLPFLDEAQVALDIATRFIDSLTQRFELAKGQASIGTSIGIVLVPAPAAGQRHDIDQLVARADRAMYQSKEAGRNRYTLAEPA